MKNNFIYLLGCMDEIIKEVLSHTKDMRTQAQLLKNRQSLKESLEKLEEECDKIIISIEQSIKEGS
jgi:uncharacterized protein Yka (UPF0111/DUF47 family)